MVRISASPICPSRALNISLTEENWNGGWIYEGEAREKPAIFSEAKTRVFGGE
jgi:hypothetical protein